MARKRERGGTRAGTGTAADRERSTPIPSFDPEALAKELDEEAALSDARPTLPPPFDPSAYARIVEENVALLPLGGRDTPRTLVAASGVDASPAARDDEDSYDLVTAPSRLPGAGEMEAIGREMYGSYLESNFPEALVLAERVLEHEPSHSLAQLVAERCRTMLGETDGRARRATELHPSSIVRLREPRGGELDLDTTSMFVLAHVNGPIEAQAVAELAGIPRDVAMDRLHALLDLGLLEVV